MHGIGNDYVYVDLFDQILTKDIHALAVEVSRPHFGIGSDGLILIERSDVADAKMRIFNADGSEAKMCGNGIRCVGKYLYDAKRCEKDIITIETLSGIKPLEMQIVDGVCAGATVDMGEPRWGEQAGCIQAQGHSWRFREVNMGNAHAVLFLPTLPDNQVFESIGKIIECDAHFPDRANVEFCLVTASDSISVRVWERGSGETLACGTGACAVVVAGVVEGVCARHCSVTLPGGTLRIHWNEKDNHVYMTGPATTAFAGTWQ